MQFAAGSVDIEELYQMRVLNLIGLATFWCVYFMAKRQAETVLLTGLVVETES